MKNMLDWFDEAIKVIPQEHYQSIKITKEKILIECEALVEKIDYYNIKRAKMFNEVHNPAYFCIEILNKQKEIILKWFERNNKNIDDFDFRELKEVKELLKKFEEDIIKIHNSLIQDLKNIYQKNY